jgi:integrase
MRNKLTDKRVQNAQPPRTGRVELADALEPGLALRITADDRRSWAVRLWTGPADRRVQRRITLGHPRERDGSPVLTLAQARQAAREVKQAAAEGKPLVPSDGVRRGAVTFGELALQYLAWADGTKRSKTNAERRRMLASADFAMWGDRPAASITAADVRALRDAITERGAPIMATRVLRFIGALGRWAVSEGKLPISPAAGVLPRTAEQPRERVLTDDEIAAFVRACDVLGFPFGPLFKLLLLTGQRLREVAEMEWTEVNLEKHVWEIPGFRCKNGTPHTVHLSEPAAAILTMLAEQRAKVEILRTSPFVFTTTGITPVSGFSRAKERLDTEITKLLEHDVPQFSLHDLRRVAATTMARLKIAPHVVDKILNHSAGAIRGTAAVYNRFRYLEDRQAALEALGRYVASLAEPAGNVVPLQRA